MHIILGNYGNDTIALMQWAFEARLQDVFMISIDTGWAAPEWQQRIELGQACAERLDFQPVRLQSKASFAELVRNRQAFPSRKYQWCPSMLKALPLLSWLDEHDPRCEGVVLLAKRRDASRANAALTEFIEESEHHGERKVWQPLYLHSQTERDTLIQRAGFEVLPHRSLECDPCIHNTEGDFNRMSESVIERLKDLETEIDKPMFSQPITELLETYRNAGKSDQKTYNDTFDAGCGSPWGCGQ